MEAIIHHNVPGVLGDEEGAMTEDEQRMFKTAKFFGQLWDSDTADRLRYAAAEYLVPILLYQIRIVQTALETIAEDACCEEEL